MSAVSEDWQEWVAGQRRFIEKHQAAAARRRPRAMTRKAARAAAEAAAGGVSGLRPRLEIEVIPSSLHHKSPRQALGRTWWNRVRKQAFAAAGNRCEICGGTGSRHAVEAHEVYDYDELATPPVQRIIRLIALCPSCHAVKHLYRTHAVSIERQDPGIYQDALAYLARINEWDDAQVQAYLKETAAAYQRRSALGPWRQDFSALGVTVPPTHAESTRMGTAERVHRAGPGTGPR